MADASLSLDEIIKKKKIKPFQKQKAKAAATKKGTDARNKIIQKKRIKMGDARERLGELARQGDARQRLNQLKGKSGMAARIGPQSVSSKLTQKKATLIKKQLGVQTGKNIVRPNVTGQTRMQGKNLTRTVAGKAGKNTGATGLRTQGVRTQGNKRPAANRPVAVTIRNDRANMNQQRRAPLKQTQIRSQDVRVQRAPYRPMRPQVMTPDMVWESISPR